jgi:H+/gluconate symporter-like permease
MPIYAIVHLLCSPTVANMTPEVAQDIRPLSADLLEGLVTSMILGYIIPTVLMAIPFSSPVLHQWLGGLWQGYPVWVSLIHFLIRLVRSRRASKSDERKEAETVTTDGIVTRSDAARIDEEMALHQAYHFVFAVSASTNIITFAVLASCKLAPTSFSPNMLKALTFKNDFLPPPFWSRAPMPNMAVGILNFFQYDQYVGLTAAIVWAVALKPRYWRMRKVNL